MRNQDATNMNSAVRQEATSRRRLSQTYRKGDQSARDSSPSTIPNIALIGVFLALIVLPPLGLIFGLDRSFVIEENRPLAARPHLTLDRSGVSEFRGQIEAYFNDHFGFRQRLIHWLA